MITFTDSTGKKYSYENTDDLAYQTLHPDEDPLFDVPEAEDMLSDIIVDGYTWADSTFEELLEEMGIDRDYMFADDMYDEAIRRFYPNLSEEEIEEVMDSRL